MNRDVAQNNTKWNTNLIIADDLEFEKSFLDLRNLRDQIVLFKNKLSNIEHFVNFIRLCEQFEKIGHKLGLKVFLDSCIDVTDKNSIEKKQRLEFFEMETSEDFAFISAEKRSFSFEYIDELVNDNRLKDYRRDLLRLKEEKKHLLSEKEEIILSGLSGAGDKFDDIFHSLTTTELDFQPIKLGNGKNIKVTESKLGQLAKHKSEYVRKSAYVSILNGYKQHNLTFSTNYIANVIFFNKLAKLRRYKNSFDASLQAEEIPEVVYNNLINAVNENLKYFHQYLLARKKKNNDRLSITDLSFCIYRLPNKKYDFDSGFKLCKKALKVLGDDYIEQLNSLYNERRIDVYPSKVKRSGAFEVSDNIANIFVMLNYVDDFSSIETMAHEFGHAMHSYYSQKKQPYALADYSIFVAEIASTVNEILLLEFMLKNAKTNKEKLSYLESLLQMAQTTIFRQTQFAEFEFWVHDQIDKNLPVSYSSLNDKYFKLLRTYYGKHIKIYKQFQYEWSRIPHFFNAFYVYKYATGMISAMLIAEKIKNDKSFVLDYKKFLSSGSSAKPIELLKNIGINLEDICTFRKAFDIYKNWVKQFKDGEKRC